MTNVAIGKPVEEQITDPAAATDGLATSYSEHGGFAEFRWPGTLTVDLGRSYDLTCIRLLLWDGLGGKGKERDPRTYLYRLLTSADRIAWKVIHDTGPVGTNGWQTFTFPSKWRARYIQLHGIWNSANSMFHVVELEAHDGTPPSLQAEARFSRTIYADFFSEESGDGRPIESQMRTTINRIEQLVKDNELLNPAAFEGPLAELRQRTRDIAAIEHSTDAISRQIIDPVRKQLAEVDKAGRYFGRYSKLGYFIGLIGTLLAILSMLMSRR